MSEFQDWASSVAAFSRIEKQSWSHFMIQVGPGFQACVFFVASVHQSVFKLDFELGKFFFLRV